MSNESYESILNKCASFNAYQLLIMPDLDNALWQKAEAQHSKESYAHYLAMLPKGFYQQEAILRIKHFSQLEEAVVEERKAYDAAILYDDKEHYDLYLSKFKDGLHAQEISEKLHKLIKDLKVVINWAKEKKLTEQIPQSIDELSRLSILDLSHKFLGTLPKEIGSLKNLTSLSLLDNQLTILPAEIGKLTNLTSLNLGFNQLTLLPAEIGKLTNLTSLNLGFN
jgi:methyl-accepting chemotaxis protein